MYGNFNVSNRNIKQNNIIIIKDIDRDSLSVIIMYINY